MKRTDKQGFTIVELVIVIAVIAILAAVLIPNISKLVRKANESSDLSLVRNLNTALTVENKDYATAHEAFEAVKDAGYDLTKIEAKADKNKILYDSENQCFAYLKDGKLEYYPNTYKTKLTPNDYYKLWSIETVAKENGEYTYSVYWNGADNAAVTVKGVGFDAGNKTTASVEYRGANVGRDVVIRTNGGTLTIDAPKDVVRHFYGVDKVIINHINRASYHENGTVAVSMIVKDGHVVVEEGARVKELSIPATATDDAVSVSIKTGSVVNTAVVDDTNATVEIVSGAKVGLIVGETTNISGSGASEAKENAAAKTTVATFAELVAKIADSNCKYIVLTDNITATEALTIKRDVIIDGGNFELVGSGLTGSNSRAINIGWYESGIVAPAIEVTIKNLKVTGPTGGDSRGINIADANTTVNLFDSTVTAGYYAINITGSGKNTKLNISGSTVSGWAALNIWASYHEINVSNSTLIGINDKTYNEDGWNNFATICFEADTTDATAEHSFSTIVRIKGSVIKAIEQTEGNIQNLVCFNYNASQSSVGNYIEFSGCSFESVSGHEYSFNDAPNTIKIDGVEISK